MCTGHCLLQLCLLTHSPSGTDVDKKDHDQMCYSEGKQAVSPGQELVYLYNSGADPGEVDWVASNPPLEQGKANGNMPGPQTNKEICGSQKPCEVKQPSSFLNHHVLGQT